MIDVRIPNGPKMTLRSNKEKKQVSIYHLSVNMVIKVNSPKEIGK